MTEQNEVETAPIGDGKTSDQILADIEAAQRQLEDQGQAKPMAVEPEDRTETVHVSPDPKDKPSETSETSNTDGDVPAPQGSDKSGETEELMKKKGFKTVEDIVRSYRNLERKMGSQGKVSQPKEDINPPAPTAFKPSNQDFRPSPNTPGIQQLAEAYQMTPEDIQRIAQLSNDIADFKLKQQMEPFVKEFTKVKRDIDRDNSFKRLERDPLFQNREVQLEMHKLAEEDPSVLEQSDYPERLFDKALSRIGRRVAEGSFQSEEVPRETRLGVPNAPPPSGRGSAGGPKGIPLKPPTSVSTKDFRRLSVAEMEKELKKIGAYRSEE